MNFGAKVIGITTIMMIFLTALILAMPTKRQNKTSVLNRSMRSVGMVEKATVGQMVRVLNFPAG